MGEFDETTIHVFHLDFEFLIESVSVSIHQSQLYSVLKVLVFLLICRNIDNFVQIVATDAIVNVPRKHILDQLQRILGLYGTDLSIYQIECWKLKVKSIIIHVYLLVFFSRY